MAEINLDPMTIIAERNRAERHLSDLHMEMYACADRIEKLAENIESRGDTALPTSDEVALAYRVAVDEIRAVLSGSITT